jgi:hypothetical protein
MHIVESSGLAAAGAELLAAVVDQVDYGMLLVRDAGPLGMNRAARLALEQPGCPLRAGERGLHAVDSFEDAILQSALRAAARTGRRDWLVLRANQTTMALALIPLPRPGPGLADEASSPAVVLVLGRGSRGTTLSLDWYCRRHGLSPAETRVLEEMLEGLDPRAIARKHGVALSTVRTQIARITEKTGERGIRPLLLAVSLLPPVLPLFARPAASCRQFSVTSATAAAPLQMDRSCAA